MNSIWLQYKDYTGYRVSPEGNVLSIGGRYKIKVLKNMITPQGYYRVSLCKEKKVKNFFIHRLVAETYINNPNPSYCVNHKDGNKLNNNISNLEWVSRAENERHSRYVLGKRKPIGANKKKLSKKDVVEILDLYHNEGQSVYKLCRKYNVSWTHLDKITKGQKWRTVYDNVFK